MIEDTTEHLIVKGEEIAEVAEGEAVGKPPMPPEEEKFHVPARHNPKLTGLMDRINKDKELWQLWRSANINAIDRSGMNDHGPVHIAIAANVALKLARMLSKAGVEYSVIRDYGLTREDGELIVVLATALHDIGMSIGRENHEHLGVILAAPKIRELLADIYTEPELTIITSETLHAILAHRWDVKCLTVEAGVTKVGDALDMTKGRTRIPFEAGQVSIHSVSAAAIDSVTISKGEKKPIKITIKMNNWAGIFQVDELLKRKLGNSGLEDYVEVVAEIGGGPGESHLMPVYKL